MKKLLLMALSCLALASCKKEGNSPQEETELTQYDVTFTMADFSQSVEKLSGTNTKGTLAAAVGDTLKNYADYLYYYVYNSAGLLVKSESQKSTSSTFGTINDKLPTGTYNIIFAASKGPLEFYTENYEGTIINPSPYPSNWNDLFLKRLKVTVGTSPVTQQVRLDREVGGLEVTLEDAIPADAAKISVVVLNELQYIFTNGVQYSTYPNGSTTNFTLTSADVKLRNKKFFLYVANTLETIPAIIIRAYDKANGLLVEKTVSNVRVYKNQKTLLKGSLFPGSGNAALGFTVVVNPTWNTPLAPVTF